MVTAELTITGPGSGAFTLDAANSDLSDYNITNDVFNAQMVPSYGPAYVFAMRGFTIANTGYIGIYVDGPSVNIDDIVLTEGAGPEACGLELRNLSGTVTNSAIHVACPGATVGINGSDAVTISNTEFSGIETNGITSDLSGDAALTLENVTLADNGGAGLFLEAFDNSAVNILGGAMNENAGNGITLAAYGTSQVRLDGVEASGNTENGVELNGVDETAVTIANVNAARNGSAYDYNYGLRLVANGVAAVSVSDTSVSENLYGGIYVELAEQSFTELHGFTSTNNAVTQVETYTFDDATLTIDGLVATGEAEAGVAITSESTVPVVANGIASSGNSPGLVLATYEPEAVINVTDASAIGSVSSPGVVIYGNGAVNLAAATVSDNILGGILVQNEENVVRISGSTISGNGSIDGASDIGGILVFSDGGDVSIDRSTISGNTAVVGAGIYSFRGELQDPSVVRITSSTISGNTAERSGAIQLENGVTAMISHSTITDNTSKDDGPAVELEESDGVISHTIIADNRQGTDLFAEPETTINYSLIGQVSDDDPVFTALQDGIGNLVGMPAKLGPLANNGATTLTHLPLAGSKAIDSGNPKISGAPALDQRDAKRIVRVIDIGAVEVAAAIPGGGAPNALANTGAAGTSALAISGLIALLVIGAGSMLVGARRGLKL